MAEKKKKMEKTGKYKAFCFSSKRDNNIDNNKSNNDSKSNNSNTRTNDHKTVRNGNSNKSYD